SEHKLHKLAVGQRRPAKLLEAPRAGEPGGQLCAYLGPASYGEAPVRDGGVEHGVVAEDVETLQAGVLDGSDERVDWAFPHAASVTGSGCSRLAARSAD